MAPAVVYLIILAVYVPGLVYMFRGRFYRYPLISFCFLGLFSQNALGSILVAYPELVGREVFSPIVGERGYFSFTFAGMLLVQALVFYAVCGLYMSRVRPEPPTFRLDRGADRLMVGVLLLTSVGLVAAWVAQVGSPPMVEILRGNLDAGSVIRYRVESTYALQSFSAYYLGLYSLPLLIIAYALTMGLLSTRRAAYVGVILVCGVVATLPGTKGVLLDVATVMVVAYLLYCAGYTEAPARRIAFGRILGGIGLAFVPVLLMYRVYHGADARIGDMLSEMVYRLVGVNSESMAATVTYTRLMGFLDGKTFPTVRGLLTHERIDTSEEMHHFLFGPGGGAPVSALAEGYLNFGWIGFIVFCFAAFGAVIAAEWVFRRLPRNLLTFSLLVLYALFATKISQLSLFATFVSLIYVVAFGSFLALRTTLSAFSQRRSRLAFPAPAGEAP
jgi:hypothetical protein